MHSMDIVHTSAHNDYAGDHRPEAFTVHHNGDFSGDVKIDLMEPRVKVLLADRGRIHGNPIAEVTIPFEVIKQIAAEYVRAEHIRNTQDATDHDVLMGRHL